AGQEGAGLWHALVRGVANTVPGVPPARAVVTGCVPASAGGGTRWSIASRQHGRAGQSAGASDGQAVEDSWQELLHVRDDAGGRADEQLGGTGDTVRGDRQAHHAGDAQRGRAALV